MAKSSPMSKILDQAKQTAQLVEGLLKMSEPKIKSKLKLDKILSTLRSAGVATDKDVKALQKQIDALEERLSKLESKSSS